MSDIVHVPVLLEEVLEALKPKPKERFIDGTVGQGGHAEAILKLTSPDGRLLAIDRDPRNLLVAQKRLAKYGERAVFVHDSYRHAKEQATAHGFVPVDGILLDLGFSSAHVDDPERGFSFQAEGPLDMRYDLTQKLTAAVAVNEWKEEELSDIFRVYGEEPQARQVAKVIVATRRAQPILTTSSLAEIVSTVIRRRGKLHPATRVFQALRIAVNDELGELERALPDLVGLLKPGGRLAVISFHSLEDRMVKRFFAAEEAKTLSIVNKRIITASDEELKQNPRARSAKLRIAERL